MPCLPVDLLDDFVSDDREEDDSKVDLSQRKEWSQVTTVCSLCSPSRVCMFMYIRTLCSV